MAIAEELLTVDECLLRRSRKEWAMADVILIAEIPSDRRLVLDLPPETPVGRAEIVIRPAGASVMPVITAGEILDSAMFGFWRDRDDIGDAAAYIERFRRDEEARRNPWKRA